MSATGRGGERIEHDFYGTRSWIVHRLLDRFDFPGGLWLEPTAGDGAIIRAVSEFGGYTDVQWNAHEIRPEGLAPLKATGAVVTIGNFLKASCFPSVNFDVAITNPPYEIAMEVLLKLLSLSQWVVLLLRLNFLGSEERSSFFRREMPDIYVLPNRPSFAQSVSCTKKKLGCSWQHMYSLEATPPRLCSLCGSKTRVTKSDATEYAWFVWTPERGRSSGRAAVLDETPAGERR